MLIFGVNAVLEALRAGRVSVVRVAGRRDERIGEIVRLAESLRVPVEHVPAAVLARQAHEGVHQGVVAEVGAAPEYTIQNLVGQTAAAPLVIVLDGIEDPHNLGAILRTADAAGADGVVRQTRHAAALGGVVAKASAGAVAHVKIAPVVNIARALEELKEAGVWTVGLAGDAPKRYDDLDFTLPTALVFGAEGRGLRRLVRERCDWLVSIPMRGRVQSLNVSVAAGIVLFEVTRQRRHLK